MIKHLKRVAPQATPRDTAVASSASLITIIVLEIIPRLLDLIEMYLNK